MWKNFYRWINDRTGIDSLIRRAKEEPIRGGARWAYVFGSAVLLLLLVQGLTGIFLTLYYVPSSDHAHASVAFIQKAVPSGALLRGLHYYGANALIILIVCHFLQAFLFGSYKQKRELLWLSGLFMALLLLGFAFTGYLLPWTQEAFFATKVGTSIMGEIPLVGPMVQRIMLGGREISTLTLSRFYTLHVWLLPLILIVFAISHVALFRKAGAAGPFHHRDDARVEMFYPRQAFIDAVFFLILFLVLVVVALRYPAILGPEADPTSDYLARPPWYFLPLFQLLKYFPGKLTLIPSIILPGIILIVLALLPFLDKKEERDPAYRPVATLFLLAGLLGTTGLIAMAKYQDYANPSVRAKFESQRQNEMAYMDAPFQPEEIGRTIAVQVPTVVALGNVRNPVLKIYFANCANCHGADATGGPMGPSLIRLASTHHLSRDFLIRYIAGHTREPSPDSMPRFSQLSYQQRAELADWLLQLHSPQQLVAASESQGPKTTALASTSIKKEALKVRKTMQPAAEEISPPEAFSKNCAFCHGNQAQGNIGPSLVGITQKPQRSVDDLLKLLDNPRAYGLKDPMPAQFPNLAEADKKAIVEWLAKLQ